MAEPPPPLPPPLTTVTPGGSINSSSLSATAVSSVATGPGPQAIIVTGPLPSLPLEGGREYRKGNWTLHETVILIAAKKKDEERRMRGGDKDKNRTAELRWKWIENYCYLNGCHRNQNQCNDKWDNLLRDYKKVRDYELRLQQAAAATSGGGTSSQATVQSQSYWQLEKHERKEKGLPSNLLFQVYEALHEVVDKRYPLRSPAASSSCPPPPPLPQPVAPPQLPSTHLAQEYHAPQQQQQQQQQIVSAPLPLYHQHQAQAETQQQPSFAPNLHPEIKPYGHHHQTVHHAASSEPSDTSESDGSEIPHSPAKRRKLDKGTNVISGAGASGVGTSTVEGLGAAVLRSTAELSQTLLACEERKDQRHRELLGVEEKKLVLESTKAEISREGIAGLINAINNLASAVLSLASDKKLTSS